jgi:hypothetical protein
MTATLTPDERRVLEFLATESVYPEQLLLDRGYSVYFLADLVRSGLASVTAEQVGSAPTASTVFWLCITNRGREALHDASGLMGCRRNMNEPPVSRRLVPSS